MISVEIYAFVRFDNLLVCFRVSTTIYYNVNKCAYQK